ncbi:MAG: tetratricopeptide repeat protein [Deltaproteobacteria bacterium]|nr:tetratricopeptide repeat protein [Deltaproteobacteria bacterium]
MKELKNRGLTSQKQQDPQTQKQQSLEDQTQKSMKAAKKYFIKGDYLNSIKEYNFVIEHDPKNITAMYDKGLVQYYIKELNDALKSFNDVLKLDKTHANAHFYKGRVLAELNRVLEAISSFENAVFYDPEFAYAYYNLADLLLKTYKDDSEKTKKAEESFYLAYKIWEKNISDNPYCFVQDDEMGEAYKRTRKLLSRLGKIDSSDYKSYMKEFD